MPSRTCRATTVTLWYVLDLGVYDAVAVAALAVGMLGILFALLAWRSVRRMRGSLALLHRESEEPSLVETTGRNVKAIDTLHGEITSLRADLSAAHEEFGNVRQEIANVREELTHTVRRVSLMRYDAFADVGGRMSFSVALLGDDGGGVVLTGINGRNETRVYAKRIVDGEGEHELSPEEREAIAHALGRQPVPRSR